MQQLNQILHHMIKCNTGALDIGGIHKYQIRGSVQSCHGFLGGVIEVLGGEDGQAGVGDDLLGVIHIGALEPDHKRDLK